MIIAILGDVGSGKSLTATKKILNSQLPAFVNFNIRNNNKTIIRLRKEHIVTEEVISIKKDGTPNKIKYNVNWDFWNQALKKYKNYNICIDEVHNIIHSRRAVSNWNVSATIWISQIRKILGDSEKSNIYLISQRVERIDVAFRDLLNGIIYCIKVIDYRRKIPTKIYNRNKNKFEVKLINPVYIFNHYFIGADCVVNFHAWKLFKRKTYSLKSKFLANNYFSLYDSFQMFGESAYL